MKRILVSVCLFFVSATIGFSASNALGDVNPTDVAALAKSLSRLNKDLEHAVNDGCSGMNCVRLWEQIRSSIDIAITHGDRLPDFYVLNAAQVATVAAIAKKLCDFNPTGSGYYAVPVTEFFAARTRGAEFLARLQKGSSTIVTCP